MKLKTWGYQSSFTHYLKQTIKVSIQGSYYISLSKWMYAYIERAKDLKNVLAIILLNIS